VTPSPPSRPPADSPGHRAFAVSLLFLAGLWLASALAAIANFAFRYPAFDQFRMYTHYLGRDFPASALQLENGHRPVLPGLVRTAEVYLTGADHSLQILSGVALALATMGLIALRAWRDRTSALSGAAMVLLAVLAVFWLGQARTLMHSYEAVHVYMVTLFAVLAIGVVHRADAERPIAPMAWAGVLALAATFSFGPGMACFVPVFLLAFVRRLPLRSLGVPALLFAVAAMAYLGGLPGDDNVRGVLTLRPLDNLRALLHWLASPFFHAWLGFAEPSMGSWTPADGPVLHRLLRASAGAVAVALGPDWKALSATAIGALGLCGWAALLVRDVRRRGSGSATGSLALGLSSFGLAVGAIIALARLAYFDVNPGQVMADRYLPWPVLFWLGLALALCGRAARSARPAVRAATPALALLLFVALLPSHRGLAGWSAAVHRLIQQSAVAAQLGIWDGERFPRPEDSARADVEKTLALMRERRLAMYAEPAYALRVDGWRAPAEPAVEPAGARATLGRRFRDDLGGGDVAALEGWLPDIAGRPREVLLVVVDAQGAQRGLAKLSSLGPDEGALRLGLPEKRGFDGYVLAPRLDETLRLLVLDPADRRVLAQVAVSPGP
jgi:hypothetical protein